MNSYKDDLKGFLPIRIGEDRRGNELIGYRDELIGYRDELIDGFCRSGGVNDNSKYISYLIDKMIPNMVNDANEVILLVNNIRISYPYTYRETKRKRFYDNQKKL